MRSISRLESDSTTTSNWWRTLSTSTKRMAQSSGSKLDKQTNLLPFVDTMTLEFDRVTHADPTPDVPRVKTSITIYFDHRFREGSTCSLSFSCRGGRGTLALVSCISYHILALFHTTTIGSGDRPWKCISFLSH
uniref:Uncharacterized protein n=1 Tax=Nelumbo nucifera TaxID=4432 RepID=A0A822Y8F3_NELNU|nr:TPA_asm: hypothetical protein HUJ06_030248 [Nelumbo nucifera]